MPVFRIRLSIVLLTLLFSGCSLLQPPPEPPPEPLPLPELPPEPPPVVDEAPDPEPLPPPPPPPPPEPAVLKVAVVLSSRAPAFENVALALAEQLDDVEIYDLSDRSLSVRDAFDAIHNSEAGAIVAIGLRAAVHARDFAAVPVVFSQVFNIADHDLLQENIRGVAVLPPLARQLESWRELTPELDSVGAIVGAGHASLLEEAERAAAANGVTFHHRIASSDRETLYLFTRMVPEIDGFWLFPDNRILSSEVLREMLDYAVRHNVQIAVFNDSLLELGAALSATADARDIATTVREILNEFETGRLDQVPPLSPLSEIRIRLNGRLKRRLQLAESQAPGASR